METKKAFDWIRFGVIVTFLCLLSIVLVFEYSMINGWTKTGLWKFTHKPIRKLDEREIAVVSKSLRYGYAIFSVVVLCFFLFLSLTGNKVSIVMAGSFILFAHLIPASIIAWTEKKF